MVTYLPRPERFTAEERKRQIIEAAIDLFSQKGFRGTTTKEIAAAAGVNEAIIFRHFETKEQLYKAILDHKLNRTEFQTGLATLETLMAAEDDEAVFGWLITRVLETYRNDPRFERLMLYAALEGHEIAVMHHNLVSPYVQSLREYVERRQAAGAIRRGDAFLKIVAAVGAAKQFAMGKYLFQWKRSAKSDEEVAQELASTLLTGLCSAPHH